MMPQTEKTVLSIVMDRNDLAPILFENTTEETFHDSCRVAYRTMKELSQDGMDLTWTTVRDHTGADCPSSFWDAAMDSTRGVPGSKAESFLVQKIQELKVDGGRKTLLQNIESIAKKPGIGEDDIDALEESVRSMHLVSAPKESPEFAEAMASYNEAIRQKASGITLGLPSFDRRIDGFNPGELVTIMARTTVGKTFLALNILNHLAASPLRLAMFSLEMPKSAVAERLMEIFFGFTRYEIKQKSLDGSLYMPDFEARFESLDIYDKIYSASEIRRHIEGKRYQAVVIDFLHLVRSEAIGGPYVQISQIIRDLKQIAKDMQCVLFLLHQLSRQAGDGGDKVELKHARDSGQIEELSDFVIGAWRPELAADAPLNARSVIRACLLKNKRGEPWMIEADFDKTCGKIYEIELGKPNIGGPEKEY